MNALAHALHVKNINALETHYAPDVVTFDAPPPAWQPWIGFRMTVSLTDAEFATIAGNVAPYMR